MSWVAIWRTCAVGAPHAERSHPICIMLTSQEYSKGALKKLMNQHNDPYIKINPICKKTPRGIWSPFHLITLSSKDKIARAVTRWNDISATPQRASHVFCSWMIIAIHLPNLNSEDEMSPIKFPHKGIMPDEFPTAIKPKEVITMCVCTCVCVFSCFPRNVPLSSLINVSSSPSSE